MTYREYIKEHWREVRIAEEDLLRAFPDTPRSACMGLMKNQRLVDLIVADRAGPAARIVRGPERSALGNHWSVLVDVPSPEGLLL